jgi:hypothetical protein
MFDTSKKSDNHEDPQYTMSGAVHVPAGAGATTWFAGDTYTVKASRESTNPGGRCPGSVSDRPVVGYPARLAVSGARWSAPAAGV